MVLRILATVDFHSRREAYENAITNYRKGKYDILIVAGDIANFSLDQANEFLNRLEKEHVRTFFVGGNIDDPKIAERKDGEFVKNLHGRCLYHSEAAFMGLGGAPFGPFKTSFEYSEEECGRMLAEAVRGYRGGRLVLVSHCPAKDTKVDAISQREHGGSTSVRNFVLDHKPLVVISGHIHEGRGTDKLDGSILVNPGPAMQNHYAVIEIDESARVSLADF